MWRHIWPALRHPIVMLWLSSAINTQNNCHFVLDLFAGMHDGKLTSSGQMHMLHCLHWSMYTHLRTPPPPPSQNLNPRGRDIQGSSRVSHNSRQLAQVFFSFYTVKSPNCWHCAPGVKDSDDGTHVLGCAYGRQAGHPTPNDQHLGRGDPPRCRDLACEEPPKLVGSLHNSPAGHD